MLYLLYKTFSLSFQVRLILRSADCQLWLLAVCLFIKLLIKPDFQPHLFISPVAHNGIALDVCTQKLRMDMSTPEYKSRSEERYNSRGNLRGRHDRSELNRVRLRLYHAKNRQDTLRLETAENNALLATLLAQEKVLDNGHSTTD